MLTDLPHIEKYDWYVWVKLIFAKNDGSVCNYTQTSGTSM